MMRTLDASRWQRFRWAEAPAALPFAFSGAKIAVAVAVIGAVLAEITSTVSGGPPGLGRLIVEDGNQLETARQFASVFVLSAMAMGLFGLLALGERRIVTWR
jgi:ABC-type nitrate/sulfonate/bicarbonate transport system permease component